MLKSFIKVNKIMICHSEQDSSQNKNLDHCCFFFVIFSYFVFFAFFFTTSDHTVVNREFTSEVKGQGHCNLFNIF